MDDDNTLLKRLNRYARVAGAGASVAATYWTHDAASDQLAEALYRYAATLRGPLMKIPQLLATIPDFLPPAYQERFLTLQANVPPMGGLFVQRRMRSELGADWAHHFAEFNTQAAFAASLGQVHRGMLHDGTPVACKLQYPDMDAAVQADLAQLRALVKLYETTQGGAIQASEVLAEVEAYLPQELDYTLEARHAQRFEALFEGTPYIRVPTPMIDLTTQRLLTMTWLEGESVLTFLDAPQDHRNQIVMRLFEAWYKPLYQHGLLHGDPHAGNYTIAPDGAINLLDFGCVRQFEPSVVAGVVQLYRALRANDADAAYNAFQLWGFPAMDKALFEIMLTWARFLYGPVLEDRVVDLADEFPSRQGQKIAAEILTQLRTKGGVKPPRSFVFLDRAAVGMGSIFLRLRARLNFHALYETILEKGYAEPPITAP